ncbi:Rossmann fold domain-containing protein [Erythrobacter sp.]|jgi:hypothetical protein|uniref:Rossmann fold domain-containing protein n=1 Tax=Erythrobacter sp. TaxID=1042 RepID=UPI002EC41E6C|nr:hypothetical protein [Erythrobacter sp.]
MAQRIYEVPELPGESLAAASAFHERHLAEVRDAIEPREGESLVVTLPAAGPDHADWRSAIARDLARAMTPARVNLAAGADPSKLAALIVYLAGAPGVTGHYLETHD